MDWKVAELKVSDCGCISASMPITVIMDIELYAVCHVFLITFRLFLGNAL